MERGEIACSEQKFSFSHSVYERISLEKELSLPNDKFLPGQNWNSLQTINQK